MRDQALVALNDLAFSTGEKAKEAVQKAHEEFAKLTDEAMKALEKDKAKFNNFMGKFFGDAADEGTKNLVNVLGLKLVNTMLNKKKRFVMPIKRCMI